MTATIESPWLAAPAGRRRTRFRVHSEQMVHVAAVLLIIRRFLLQINTRRIASPCLHPIIVSAGTAVAQSRGCGAQSPCEAFLMTVILRGTKEQ
jgi:hypothetical protein